MCPIDSSKHTTSVLMPEFLDINLKGLIVLSNLRILIAGKLTSITIKSTKLDTTIKKSRIFQDSLKYEY